MSSSDNSSTDESKEPAGVADQLVTIQPSTPLPSVIHAHIYNLFQLYFQDETNEVDIIEKNNDILTKVEAGFYGITKKIIKCLGKEFADGTLKSLLECAICKETIIVVNIYT